MKNEMKTKVMIAGAAFCAALFLFSGFMLCREYLDQKQSAEAFEEVAELVKEEPDLPVLELESGPEPVQEEMTAFDKYANVYAQNSDLVGWVSIPGTRIDYPVMQTKDNPDFYLKHAFDKSYSSYGVPYVQENCDIGISDNLVLYGHHMNNGSMFPNEESVENTVLHKLEVDKLHTALAMLTPEEQALIQALFFEEKTERQYAEELGVYRNAIHVRKTKTLKKLKKLLE